MQEKMWAYLIHLGSNMWGDRYAQNPAVPFPAIPKYREELLAQKDVWTKVTNFLAEAGLNTLVIDLGEGVQYASHPELGAKGAWTAAELRAELDRLDGASLGSDAFFPFDDSIVRARMSGVKYVAEPGGSVRDQDVIARCDDYGMVLAMTHLRLFHH